MLAAVVAVLIPIIIEWLFRKRKRQVELPTIRYLLRNKEQEKVKRQDRLLLLLRMFALFLLVLAIARPVIRHSMLGKAGKRHAVVLLDGTASMQQQVRVTTAFGWAQKSAATMVRELPEGATVTVGYVGRRAESVVIGEKDVSTAAARIEALHAGSGAGTITSGLDWIKQALETQKEQKARAREKRAEQGLPAEEEEEESTEIYIFSDFQRMTWPASDRRIEPALRELAQGRRLYLVDVGGRHQFNYMVTRLEPAESAICARMPVEFIVQIRATGTPPGDISPTVTLLVNGDKKGVREISAITDINQTITCRFQLTFPQAGEYVIEVQLEGDEHRADNTRLYIAQVPEDLRVLILDETAIPGNLMPASTYLARAIAPPTRRGMAKVSRFSAKVALPSEVIYENLAFSVREERRQDPDAPARFTTVGYVAVVLAGSSFLTAEMAATLERYVAEGGSLWLFMGDRVNPRRYNNLLYKGGEGLMPCRLKRPVSVDASGGTQVVPDFGSSTHPAFAFFSGVATPADAAVRRYVDLEVANKAEVLVNFTNQGRTPAVIAGTFGRGSVWLTNTTAGAEWTYLPARAEFTIFVQEVLRHLVGNPDRSANLAVGRPFQQLVYASNQQLLLRCPDGTARRLRPALTDVENAWRIEFTGTDQQGLYEIDPGRAELARRRFVVNQDTMEADLSRHAQGDIEGAFGTSATWIPRETDLAEFVSRLHGETRVAPGILWTLVAVLALESFLAARFGRRRGGSTA